jgi:alpha-galactosidase
MMKLKIVIIGSGSQFTEFFLQELFKFEEFKGLTLVLVDRKPERLKHEVALAKTLNESTDWEVDVFGFEERERALEGASFVYVFAAVNQRETWKKEFELANKYDINLLEAYTGGPAKLGMSIRHVPIMLDICNDIERLCPDAWLIMDNNPLPSLVAAVHRHTNVKNVGYCNGHELVEVALEQILEMTDRDPGQRFADPVEREFMTASGNISITLAGINHITWLLDIRKTDNGDDLYPELRKRLEIKELIPEGYHYSAEICKRFGYFPSCADGHISDHLWFTDKIVNETYGMKPYPIEQWFGNRDDKAWEKITAAIKNKNDVFDFISRRRTGWYNVQIARFMLKGGQHSFPAVNVVNNGAISNLPSEIVVEVPGIIGPDFIFPAHVGNLPEQIMPICALNGSITNLVADAAATGSKEMAFQALLLDPFVHSMTKARQMLDEILEYNSKYVTRFS